MGQQNQLDPYGNGLEAYGAEPHIYFFEAKAQSKALRMQARPCEICVADNWW